MEFSISFQEEMFMGKKSCYMSIDLNCRNTSGREGYDGANATPTRLRIRKHPHASHSPDTDGAIAVIRTID